MTASKKVVIVAAAIAVVGAAGACSDSKSSDDNASSAANSAGNAAQSAMNSGMNGAPGAAGENGGKASAAPAPAVESTAIAAPDGQQVEITDQAVLAKYAALGYDKGVLGKPLGPVVPLPTGGKFITFEHGSIYQNPENNQAYIEWGEIGDYWGTQGHEHGRFGYPTSDETAAPGGGLQQTYQHGTITFKDGKVAG
jgi:uncharacterized protein with LGFP repeats